MFVWDEKRWVFFFLDILLGFLLCSYWVLFTILKIKQLFYAYDYSGYSFSQYGLHHIAMLMPHMLC